jgi:transposase
LDERIAKDNEVRAIDAFVSSLDLEKLGFRVHFSEGGRPAYRPALLLKLYFLAKAGAKQLNIGRKNPK